MAEVPQDPKELRLAIAAAMGLSPDRCGQGQALKAYCYALSRAWDRMQAVVGELGAEAILRHAIKMASRRQPEVAKLVIGEKGLDLAKLEAAAAEGDSEAFCRSVKELYMATFQTLRELTGEVVVGPLLDEMSQRKGDSDMARV